MSTTTHKQIRMEPLEQIAERLGLDEPGNYSVGVGKGRAPAFPIFDLTEAFAIFAVLGQAQFGETEITDELDAGALAEDAEIVEFGTGKLLLFRGWTVIA